MTNTAVQAPMYGKVRPYQCPEATAQLLEATRLRAAASVGVYVLPWERANVWQETPYLQPAVREQIIKPGNLELEIQRK